jgi:hypothetical protein
MDAAEMGQGSCKASPTKDRITDDFYERDLEANVPLEASVSERVLTRCVRIVPLPVRFQRLYQADPATAQSGRTCSGVRWLASCTPRSRACGADIDSATNGWKIGREYIRRKNDGLVRDAVSLHAPGG